MRSTATADAALAQLIRTEAERVQSLGQAIARPESFADVLAFQHSIYDILMAMTRRDEALLRKLQGVHRAGSPAAAESQPHSSATTFFVG